MAEPPPLGIAAGACTVAAAAQRQPELQQLSLSQVDPSVLAELPAEVRQEVLQQLQAGGGAGGRAGGRPQQHRSRLGQLKDEERAWRRRWEDEQQQRAAEAAEAAAVVADDPGSPLLTPRREEEQGAEQHKRAASPLPPAVQQFAEMAVVPASAVSLAAALAECLEQLLAAAAAGEEASPPQQRSRTPSPNSSSGGRGDSSKEMEVDEALPPTQPVVLEREDQQGPAGSLGCLPSGAEAAGAQAGGSSQPLQQSPWQDSMQQRDGGPASDEGPQQHAAGSAGSRALCFPRRPGGGELQHGLQALGRSLQHAAGALLAAGDLEQLRLLLLAAQRLCRRHPCFAEGGGGAAVEAAQRGVERRYSWRLRLGGLLDATEAVPMHK